MIKFVYEKTEFTETHIDKDDSRHLYEITQRLNLRIPFVKSWEPTGASDFKSKCFVKTLCRRSSTSFPFS